jgi:hypothetical protein
MRRLMLTLAVVLVVGAVEVKAQGHEAPAAPAAKHETPAAKGHETPAAKAPETPAEKAPVDVATVLKRIEKHVAEVSEISRPRPAVHSAPAAEPKKSPAPRAASRARVTAPKPSAQARVELDWRTPFLVWPDENLRPEVVDSGDRRETAKEQVGDDQRHDDVEGLAANERERGAPFISSYKPAQ